MAAAAQLRAIRHAAYTDVRLFRSLQGAPGNTRERRRTLEQMSDQLGDLELELPTASKHLNATQVSARRSMFSGHYVDMCLAVRGLLAVGAVLSLEWWVRHQREARHHRASTARPR